MMNSPQGLGSWLAKIIRKKPTVQTTNTPATETDSVYQDSEETKRRRADVERLQGIIAKPPPDAVKPEIDPYLAGISTLASLFTLNPQGKSNLQSFPFEYAQKKADDENKRIFDRYGMERANNEDLLRSSQDLLGMSMNRDTVAAKIEDAQRRAVIAGQIKESIANAKNNQMLISAMAKLAATGGLTLPSVKMVFSELHPEWGEDTLEQAAQDFFNEYERNSSLRVKIEQATLANKEAALNQKSIADSRKMLLSVNATFEERVAAMVALKEAGDPYYAQMPESQMMQEAANLGAMTEQAQARTKNIAEDTKYKEARTAYTKKLTEIVGPQAAARIAASYAQIDHYRNMDSVALEELSLEELDKIHDNQQKAYDVALKALQQEYARNQSELIAMKKLKDADGNLIHSDFSPGVLMLRAKLQQIKTEADNVRKQMQEDGFSISDIEQNKGTPPAGGLVKGSDGVYRPVPKGNGGVPSNTQNRSQSRSQMLAGRGTLSKIATLKESAVQAFPFLKGNIGQYGAGSIPTSLHKSGQALDFGEGGGSRLTKAQGDSIVKWLQENHKDVKTIIWDGRIWTPSKGWHKYSGPNDHKGHVHVDYGR